MTSPKVSVITGYFNRGPVLRRTIESILSQTYTDFELLVFDDGSTDDTAERLAQLKLEFNDPRFNYVSHENKGFVAGLIDAIDQSSGEYIAIQGSGDVSRPDRLRRQVDLLDQRSDIVAVGCWYMNIDEHSGARDMQKPKAENAVGGNTTFSQGEMMMRRSAYVAAGGYRPEMKFGQLTELGYRLRHHGSFATVPTYLYDRYIQSDGVTFNVTKTVAQARYLALATTLRDMADSEAELLLEQVRRRGIETVIPGTEALVQSTIRNKVLLLILLNRSADGRKLARQVVPSSRRFVYLALTNMGRLPVLGNSIRLFLRAVQALKRFVWPRYRALRGRG